MSPAGRTGPRPERVRAALADPGLREAIDDGLVPIPDDALDWLAQICLLEGLPFDALVPDAAMLPPESIRFFHVDQNWLDALVDGALSIANVSGDARSMLRLLRTPARDGAHVATAARRPAKLAAATGEASLAAGDAPPPATAWSGLILRSCVVADFPGLTVTAYPDPAGTQTALTPLRLEHLSDTMLIAIFDGVAQRIEIAKPAHVLHFGVEPVGEYGPPFQVPLRGIGVGKWALGQEIEPTVAVDVVTRTAGDGPEVVDVLATVQALEAGLADPKVLDQPVTLSAATTGVELVQATECAVFGPVAGSFTASPGQIAAGGTSTLSWAVTGATACTIDQGIGSLDFTGTHPVSPQSTTTYTLTATAGDVTSPQEVTVTVGDG